MVLIKPDTSMGKLRRTRFSPTAGYHQVGLMTGGGLRRITEKKHSECEMQKYVSHVRVHLPELHGCSYFSSRLVVLCPILVSSTSFIIIA